MRMKLKVMWVRYGGGITAELEWERTAAIRTDEFSAIRSMEGRYNQFRDTLL